MPVTNMGYDCPPAASAAAAAAGAGHCGAQFYAHTCTHTFSGDAHSATHRRADMGTALATASFPCPRASPGPREWLPPAHGATNLRDFGGLREARARHVGCRGGAGMRTTQDRGGHCVGLDGGGGSCYGGGTGSAHAATTADTQAEKASGGEL